MAKSNMGFYEMYCEEVAKNDKLVAENKRLKAQILSLTNRVKYLEAHMDEIIDKKVDAAASRSLKNLRGRLYLSSSRFSI